MEEISRRDIEALIISLAESEKSLAHLKSFWRSYERVSVGQEASINWVDEFTDYLIHQKDPDTGTVFPKVLKYLLGEELRLSTRSTLFRENSIGMAIITRYWYRSEGTKFLQYVVGPMTDKIGKTSISLEVDAQRADKGVNVKQNARFILHELEELINRIYSVENGELFPKFYKLFLQLLDSMATLKYQDLGNSLIGGILFLRLINPAIIFPQKYDLAAASTLTSSGQRGLLIASKILQRLANESTFNEELEPQMMFANRFIKKHLPTWKAFFTKFVTGKDITDLASVKSEITPEDLVNLSNQDIYFSLICPMTKSKQKEMFQQIFNIEKQSNDWPSESSQGIKSTFKKFNGTSVFAAKLEFQVKGSPEEIMNFCMTSHVDETSASVGSNFERTVLKEHSANLRVVHTVHKTHPLLRTRDFVTLNFNESLPDENFAISCCSSIEHPKTSNYIRGELLAAFLFRGTSQGITNVVALLHMDAKGNGKLAPANVVKKGVLKTQKEWARTMISHFNQAV